MRSTPLNEHNVSVYLPKGMKAELQKHCDTRKPRPVTISSYIAALVRKDLKKHSIRKQLQDV
jgi:hypothetical protein